VYATIKFLLRSLGLGNLIGTRPQASRVHFEDLRKPFVLPSLFWEMVHGFTMPELAAPVNSSIELMRDG
jgi:hypothetical protein